MRTSPLSTGGGSVPGAAMRMITGFLEPDDGCSPECVSDVRPYLLRCGSSTRDVADFIPDGVDLQVLASCTPGLPARVVNLKVSVCGVRPSLDLHLLAPKHQDPAEAAEKTTRREELIH